MQSKEDYWKGGGSSKAEFLKKSINQKGTFQREIGVVMVVVVGWGGGGMGGWRGEAVKPKKCRRGMGIFIY